MIETARVLHGLEPLEEFYKNALFAIKDPRAKEFAFGLYKHINQFEMETEEECAQLWQLHLCVLQE
jgi:phosphate uptake regulator